MPVVYLNFSVQFHGIDITRQEDIDAIKMKLDAAACRAHPTWREEWGPRGIDLDNDVSVDLIEHAGEL